MELRDYEELLPHGYQISDTEAGQYSTTTIFLKSILDPLQDLLADIGDSYRYFDINLLKGDELDRYAGNYGLERDGRNDDNFRRKIIAYQASFIAGGHKDWFTTDLPNLLGIKEARIYEKYPAKAIISPLGMVDIDTLKEVVTFSKPVGVDIIWGIIWLVMKEKTWAERKLLKWIFYRTGGVHNKGMTQTANYKIKAGIEALSGELGYYDREGMEPVGLQNVVNWQDNGVFADMPKP